MSPTRCWTPPPGVPLEEAVARAVAEGDLTAGDGDQLLRFGAFLQEVPPMGERATERGRKATRRALFRAYGETSETEARMVVRQRSNGRCELDVRNVCRGKAESWSHRQSRARRGLWTPANGIDACGSGTTGCHGWLESHPTWAEAAGLSLPSWVDDPQRVPAYVSWHGLARSWWHLNLDGTLTPCQELERPPWGHSADHALECPGACR